MYSWLVSSILPQPLVSISMTMWAKSYRSNSGYGWQSGGLQHVSMSVFSPTHLEKNMDFIVCHKVCNIMHETRPIRSQSPPPQKTPRSDDTLAFAEEAFVDTTWRNECCKTWTPILRNVHTYTHTHLDKRSSVFWHVIGIFWVLG